MNKKDIEREVDNIFHMGELSHISREDIKIKLCEFINKFGDDRFIEGFDSAIKHAEDIPEEIGGVDDEDDENFLI